MRDHATEALPPDLLDALRAPVPVPDRDRRLDDIMRAVRTTRPEPRRGLAWAWPPSLHRLRRGVLAPAASAIVAFAFLLLAGTESISAVFSTHAGLVGRLEVLGDTVIARAANPQATAAATRPLAPTPLRDTVVATLYDTLRIVRLALRAPQAVQVVLAGAIDSIAAVPRVVTGGRTADGRWELRALVPREVALSSLALLVDGVRTVPLRFVGRTNDGSVHTQRPHTLRQRVADSTR